VCYAIRDSAFVTSDLPVIVSLEVHACLEQQQTMVDIMAQAWQGLLVEVTPEMEAKWEKGGPTDLPSPDELRRKILIKVKGAPPKKSSSPPISSGNASDALDLEKTTSSSIAEDSIGGSVSGGAAPKTAGAAPKKKNVKVLQTLSRLGVYTRGYTFNNFSQPGMSIQRVPRWPQKSVETGKTRSEKASRRIHHGEDR
jgi:hypothetical protein